MGSLQKYSMAQQIVELTTKVRQLEIGIMDVKAASERKVAAIAEDMPNRLQREIRQFEQKEIQLHKEYSLNMAALQDGF